MKKVCSPSIANTIVESNSSLRSILSNMKKFKTRAKFISSRVDKIKTREEEIGDIFEMQMDELKQFADDYFHESAIDVSKVASVATEAWKQIRDKQLRKIAKECI